MCRVDNAPAFKSLADNDCLKDLGIRLDKALAINKNSNPVAEKANRELHECIVSVSSGKKITSDQLATAVSKLNSKPRWSKLSAVELWTGRDMLTGETLTFNQEDIIQSQHQKRLKTHPVITDVPQEFKENDLVFCNSEKNKLKTRDQLIVREKLDNGIYRLDRLHKNSKRITQAYLPGRDLYKPDTFEEKIFYNEDRTNTTQCQEDEIIDTPSNNEEKFACFECTKPKTETYKEKPLRKPVFEKTIPPAQGHGDTYCLPYPSQRLFLPLVMPQIFDHLEDLPDPCLGQDINYQDQGQGFHEPELEEEQEDDFSSLNYDSATDDQNLFVTEPSPERPLQPERRYPSRKRQAPITFQYEEIVNKKPK